MANRSDLPSPSAPNFDQRIRETLMTYLGRQGNPLDRGLTLRDMIDAGIVELRDGHVLNNSSTTLPIKPGPAVDGGASPDFTPPPAPSGFSVMASLTNIFIEHDKPTYGQGNGHLRTRVWGAKYTGGSLPTIADAVEIGQFSGAVYVFPSDIGTTWRLWIKWESKDGAVGLPAGGTNGLEATTGKIGNDDLGPLIVEAKNLASGSVTAGKIAANAIGANNIIAGTITGDRMAAATITAGNIAAATINGTLIAGETITGDCIASNTIISRNVAAGAILADKINVGLGGNNLIPCSGLPIDLQQNGEKYPPGWFWLNAQNREDAYLFFESTGWNPLGLGAIGSFWGNYTPNDDLFLGDVIPQPAERALPIVAGNRYEFSVYSEQHRCKARTIIGWLDYSGKYISENIGNMLDPGGQYRKGLSLWRRSVCFAYAPSNAAYAYPFVRHYGSGQDEPIGFCAGFYFGEATANQTQPSPWSPSEGGAVTIDGAGIRAKSIKADKINVTSLSAITANIGTLRTATTGARVEIADNVIKVFDTNGVLRVKIGNLSL